jgi:hypothetical protein
MRYARAMAAMVLLIAAASAWPQTAATTVFEASVQVVSSNTRVTQQPIDVSLYDKVRVSLESNGPMTVYVGVLTHSVPGIKDPMKDGVLILEAIALAGATRGPISKVYEPVGQGMYIWAALPPGSPTGTSTTLRLTVIGKP